MRITISRILSWTVIPLGQMSPFTSSNLPRFSASHAIESLFGLAPSGVYLLFLLPKIRCALTAPFHPYLIIHRKIRRFAFCCTCRHITVTNYVPRYYLALCSMESGLSSPSITYVTLAATACYPH